MWVVTLLSALFGGLVAGGLTLIGVLLTHHLDLRKQKKSEENSLQNLYRALFVEFSEV